LCLAIRQVAEILRLSFGLHLKTRLDWLLALTKNVEAVELLSLLGLGTLSWVLLRLNLNLAIHAPEFFALPRIRRLLIALAFRLRG
jgi:hypothetical protein